MTFKKNIKENFSDEFNDLDWISKSRPSLHNKVIFFEPMISNDEYTDYVLPKLESINQMGDDIKWWSCHYEFLDQFTPDNDYLHHLIIGMDGKMVYGGLGYDEVYDLRGDDYTEDQIRDAFDDKWNDIDYFIDGYPKDFDSPEHIDGRKFFDINQSKSINEGDDFDWIRNTESSPHNPYVGMKFKINDIETGDVVYTINDMTDTLITLKWVDPNDGEYIENFKYPLKTYFEFVSRGEIEIVYENLKESQDDFDWVRDVMDDNTVTIKNCFEGARVVLKKDSPYYYQAKDKVGTVTYSNGRYPEPYEDEVWVAVIWDKGHTNTYRIGNYGDNFDLNFYY